MRAYLLRSQLDIAADCRFDACLQCYTCLHMRRLLWCPGKCAGVLIGWISARTVRQSLAAKTVIEFPTLLVVTAAELPRYAVVTPAQPPQAAAQTRTRQRDRPHTTPRNLRVRRLDPQPDTNSAPCPSAVIARSVWGTHSTNCTQLHLST